MRLSLLSLVLLTGACASTAPASDPVADTSPRVSADSTAASPTAAVTIVGYPDGGAQMSVSFDAEVPISRTEPAVLVAGGERHTAALEAPPAVARHDGAATSSAAYRLDRAGRAAAEAAGTAARLMLHDGTAYRTYPVSRPDHLN